MDDDPAYKTAPDDEDDDAQALGSTRMICFTCMGSFPHADMHPMNCRKDHAMCRPCMQQWRDRAEKMGQEAVCSMCKKVVPKLAAPKETRKRRRTEQSDPEVQVVVTGTAVMAAVAGAKRTKKLALMAERDEIVDAIEILISVGKTGSAEDAEARERDKRLLASQLGAINALIAQYNFT